ncbi:MAG: TetR/AcrR family transcriptional regulator [Longimicrobiales bacterium]
MAKPDSEVIREAQQARSRKTEQAIAAALSTLMQDKRFADISVAEIAHAAGVSVGGFYGRFASKDALLAMVELSILEECEQLAAALLDPARFAGQGIPAIALAYAQLLVTSFRARRIDRADPALHEASLPRRAAAIAIQPEHPRSAARIAARARR